MSQITPGRCVYVPRVVAVAWKEKGEKKEQKITSVPPLCTQISSLQQHQLFSCPGLTSPMGRGTRRKKPKHNSVHCWFHAVKEKSSPRVPLANKSHPECALITMQTRSLKALLSITMSPVLSADRPEEEGGGAEGGVGRGWEWKREWNLWRRPRQL